MTIPDTGPDQFRQFSNPATGESVQFTATPQKAGEDVVRLNWRSMPGGAITEHVHPHQEERFAITVGQAHFTLAGEHRVVGPGETLRVPVGVRHSESNPGAVECVVELRPALHTKEMFEAFGGLGSEGKTTPRGAPKNRIVSQAAAERRPTMLAQAEPRSCSATSASARWPTAPVRAEAQVALRVIAETGFVAHAATCPSLPVRSATASEHQSTGAPGLPLTWPPVRGSGSELSASCGRLGARIPA